MKQSTCCGAETEMYEIGICPECLEHCDWEEDEQEEIEKDIEAENMVDEMKLNDLEESNKG